MTPKELEDMEGAVIGMKHAGVAAIGTLAVPVVGVLSSAPILGEPLGMLEVSVLLLVVTALAIVLLKSPSRTT